MQSMRWNGTLHAERARRGNWITPAHMGRRKGYGSVLDTVKTVL